MNNLKRLREFIKTKPYLVWSTDNYDNLSEKNIAESILNYGDWDDYLFLEKTLGIKNLNDIFKKLIDQKRTNLRPSTINYFSNYFNTYA